MEHQPTRRCQPFTDGRDMEIKMNLVKEDQCLVETIPDDLFELWRKGPLRLATKSNLPLVELRGRVLTVRWGSDMIDADVADCHFRVGRAWQMKRNARKPKRLLPFGAHDLILIDLPPLHLGFLTGKVHSRNTVPVGYTESSLATWKGALKHQIGDSTIPVMRFLNS